MNVKGIRTIHLSNTCSSLPTSYQRTRAQQKNSLIKQALLGQTLDHAIQAGETKIPLRAFFKRSQDNDPKECEPLRTSCSI